MMGDLLGDIAQWTIDVVYSFGYVGVAILTALGYLHLLVPTGLVLSLAGFMVGQGQFSFIAVLIWTTVAGAAGSLILYLPGLWISEESLRRYVRRFGRFVFVYESDLDKASKMFERHGGKAVLIGHLLPALVILVEESDLLAVIGETVAQQIRNRYTMPGVGRHPFLDLCVDACRVASVLRYALEVLSSSPQSSRSMMVPLAVPPPSQIACKP